MSLMLCAATFSGSALAQDEVLTALQNREMGGSPLAILSGPPAAGKEVLFARGIQGEMRIQVVVGADGVLREALIVVSSRSPELDNFALDLAKKMVYRPAKDKAGQPVTIKAAFPIELWKDSIVDGSLFEKRCDDFVLDADWFRQTFPEKRPDQMRSWLMLTGVIVAGRVARKAESLDITPDFQTVYNECRKKPSRKFVDIYTSFAT